MRNCEIGLASARRACTRKVLCGAAVKRKTISFNEPDSVVILDYLFSSTPSLVCV